MENRKRFFFSDLLALFEPLDDFLFFWLLRVFFFEISLNLIKLPDEFEDMSGFLL